MTITGGWRYHTISTTCSEDTWAVDLLLARRLGRDNYRIFRKGSGEYQAKFWATVEEFEEIVGLLDIDDDKRIDEEYKRLLAEE